ncbi:hypothetical protein QJS04_geneDACA001354 [Acorus gramineus]|uniref:FAS1 domain-containing protein n=1 Tax=Acorus gramineus TaxID=55184 RepID=A0AAV9AD83_ACOGR|nr:hypothetical protein QJS04_geneDACA001354 [Acorus gramineus]
MQTLPHLLLLLLLISSIPTTTPQPPTNATTPPPSPPPLLLILNILDALFGVGQYGRLPTTFLGINLTHLPPSATLFIPANHSLEDLSRLAELDDSFLPYHVAPLSLSLISLRRIGLGQRIPTLLDNRSLLITDDSDSNFSIDGRRLVRPDVLSGGRLSMHVVEAVLDYAKYGRPSEEEAEAAGIAQGVSRPSTAVAGLSQSQDQESRERSCGMEERTAAFALVFIFVTCGIMWNGDLGWFSSFLNLFILVVTH